jgi:hypothetical protein
MDLDQVIKRITEKIKGNIVLGINALKVSALKAESENKNAIEEEDVKINNELGRALSGAEIC